MKLSTASSSKKRESPLRKAAKLYELTYGLLKTQNEEDIGFVSSKLFALAAVNNLGVLHWELDEGKKATKCFEFVMSVLVLMIDCGDESRPDNNNIDGLLSNATKILLKLAVSAAAA